MEFPRTVDLTQVTTYLAPPLNALLTALIGLTLAECLWAAWPAPAPMTGAMAPVVNATPASTANGPTDLERIAAAELFGQASTPNDDPVAANAPETRLDLTLTGIVADRDYQRSWALIRVGKGEQQAYRRGDSVDGVATVKGILADRVVLSRNGRHEILTLPTDADPAQSAPGPTEPDAASKQLAEMQREISKEPFLLPKYLSIKAVYEDGELQGIRVFPTGRSRKVFQKAGIQPGAIVTRINGIPLDQTPIRPQQIAEELKQARRFIVDVNEHGDTKTVSISID